MRTTIVIVISALLLSVMSGATLAQTTDPVGASPAPAQPSVSVDVPPGGCMPIGLTASGEIVFPIQCKELIERHRGKDVEQKPAMLEEKPAVVEEKPAIVDEKPVVVEEKPAAVEEKPAVAEDKAAAKQSEAVAPESSEPVNRPVEAVPLPKRVGYKSAERATGPAGCQHFRSYDAASASYRSYDGQRHPCR
jgi:BA14K-like protein